MLWLHLTYCHYCCNSCFCSSSFLPLQTNEAKKIIRNYNKMAAVLMEFEVSIPGVSSKFYKINNCLVLLNLHYDL